jgi:hypothetical protein
VVRCNRVTYLQLSPFVHEESCFCQLGLGFIFEPDVRALVQRDTRRPRTCDGPECFPICITLGRTRKENVSRSGIVPVGLHNIDVGERNSKLAG